MTERPDPRAPDIDEHQLHARVLSVLYRLPPEMWGDPRTFPLPAPLNRQLDQMDPPMLRGLLIELIYRLETHRLQR